MIINEEYFKYRLPCQKEEFNPGTKNKINQFLKFLEEKIDFHILYKYKTIFVIKILNHSTKNAIRNSIIEFLERNDILYSLDSLFLSQNLNIKFLKILKIKDINSSNFKRENVKLINETINKEKNIFKKMFLTEKKKNSVNYLDYFSLKTIDNDFKDLKKCNFFRIKEENFLNKKWNSSKNTEVKNNILYALKTDNKFVFREILTNGENKPDNKQMNSSSKKNKFCKIIESNKDFLKEKNLINHTKKENPKNLDDLEFDYDVDNLVDKVLNSFESGNDLDENLCKRKKFKKNINNFHSSFLSKINSEEKENLNILSNLNGISTLIHPNENKTNFLLENFNQLKNNELIQNMKSYHKDCHSSTIYNHNIIENIEKLKNNFEKNKEILIESTNINRNFSDSKEISLNFTDNNHKNSSNSSINNNNKNNKPYSKSILNFMANLNKNYNPYIIQKNSIHPEMNNIKFLQNGIYYKYLNQKSKFPSNVSPYIYTKTYNAQSNYLSNSINKEYNENILIRNPYINSNFIPEEKLNYKYNETLNFDNISNNEDFLNSYKNIHSKQEFKIPMQKINSRAILNDFNNDKDFHCNFSYNNNLNNNKLKNYLSSIESSENKNKSLQIEDSIKNESLEYNLDLENENGEIKNDFSNSKKIKNSILSNKPLKSHEFNCISNREKENNNKAFKNIKKNIIDSANESYQTEISLNPDLKNPKYLNLFQKKQKKFLENLKVKKISFIDIINKEKDLIQSISNNHIPENKEFLKNEDSNKHIEIFSLAEEKLKSSNESFDRMNSNTFFNIYKIDSAMICNSSKSVKKEFKEKTSEIIEPIEKEDKKQEILETKKLKLKDILKLDKLKSKKITKLNSICINSELNKIENNFRKDMISMPPPKQAKLKEQIKSSKLFPIFTEDDPKNLFEKSSNNLAIKQKGNEIEKKFLNPYNIVYFENYSGIIKRNTPDEERKKYIINHENIIKCLDKRTTLMIKNIPIYVTQVNLVERINKNFNGCFNFFYLPIDFIKKSNVGYAFINFRDPQTIVNFCKMYEGKTWSFDNDSRKICYISYARIQGYKNICDHFKKSSIMMQIDEQIKPIMLE